MDSIGGGPYFADCIAGIKAAMISNDGGFSNAMKDITIAAMLKRYVLSVRFLFSMYSLPAMVVFIYVSF